MSKRGHWGSLEEILLLLMGGVEPTRHKTCGNRDGSCSCTCEARSAMERQGSTLHGLGGELPCILITRSLGTEHVLQSSPSSFLVKPWELWPLSKPEISPGQVGNWLASGPYKEFLFLPFLFQWHQAITNSDSLSIPLKPGRTLWCFRSTSDTQQKVDGESSI